MNDGFLLLPPSYLITLVLHKLVKGSSGSWEDVNEEMFIKLVDQVAPFCSMTEIHKPCANGWNLTFDDGNLSDYDIAFPILHERRVSATFFVIVDKVGQKGFLSWRQIIEMNKNGMNFGSHSLTHQSMVKLSKNEMMDEFIKSKRLLEDKLGTEITSFSYPFGEHSRDINRFCFDAGYQFSFTSNHGVTGCNPALIPRNSINSHSRWDDVISVLYPTISTRLRWVLEDSTKELLKTIIGRKRYIYLRDKLLHG